MPRGDTYEPTTFTNRQAPAVNATNLNRNEQAVADISNRLRDIEDSHVDRRAARLRDVPETIVDVEQIVRQNREGMVSGQSYRNPTTAESAHAVAGVAALLRGEEADLSALGMTVTRGWCPAAAKAVIVIAAERSTERCWGVYVLPVEAPIHCVIEAPHPIADAESDLISYRLWEGAPDGTALTLGGSHRTDGSHENPRDVAHNPDSMWMMVTASIVAGGVNQFQQHGFADSSAPGTDAVISSGSAPDSRSLRVLASLVERSGIRVARSWDGSATVLMGTQNPLGTAAKANGSVFAHVEASRTLRDTQATEYVAACLASGFFNPGMEVVMGSDAPGAIGSANSRGSSLTAARADHSHRLTQNDPVNGQWVGRSQGGWRALDLPAAKLTESDITALRALIR